MISGPEVNSLETKLCLMVTLDDKCMFIPSKFARSYFTNPVAGLCSAASGTLLGGSAPPHYFAQNRKTTPAEMRGSVEVSGPKRVTRRSN